LRNVEKIAIILLAFLLLYSIMVITTTHSTSIKSYLVTRTLKVEIENVTLTIQEDGEIKIAYNICNPLDFKVYIINIQSIIYSEGTYVWTNTNTFMKTPSISSNYIIKEVEFKIPQSRLKYIRDRISIITYILIEVRQPTTYKILLEFYFPNIKTVL